MERWTGIYKFSSVALRGILVVWRPLLESLGTPCSPYSAGHPGRSLWHGPRVLKTGVGVRLLCRRDERISGTVGEELPSVGPCSQR